MMAHDSTGSARKRTPDRARISIKGAWTAIPNKLLTDHRLSRDARLLGCMIFMHAGNSGRAFPSQEQMAEELGCARRSILRWLGELQQRGWITWRQTLRNNEYTLRYPEEYDDPELEASCRDASSVTLESHSDVTLESHSDVTLESHSDVTLESWTVTLESHSDVTPVSPSVTLESHCSLLLEDSVNLDSYNIDSSSSESTASLHADADGNGDDDDDDEPTATELFLQEENLGVARELRAMPLEMAQRYVADAKQRGASLPAIAKGLRARWKREQALLSKHAEGRCPPSWIAPDVWPTLPPDLRLALEDSAIDDEGYLCYTARYDAYIAAHAALVRALLEQARQTDTVGAAEGRRHP